MGVPEMRWNRLGYLKWRTVEYILAVSEEVHSRRKFWFTTLINEDRISLRRPISFFIDLVFFRIRFTALTFQIGEREKTYAEKFLLS